MQKKITVIDQTIREGMQYRGLMFSLDERKQMARFQEKLGVDICQAAYPPAHVSEALYLKELHQWSLGCGNHFRMAGLCRAIPEDVRWMVDLGLKDFHLHTGVNAEMLKRFGLGEIFKTLAETVRIIQASCGEAVINLAFADVGTTDPALLAQCLDYAADELKVDIVNLPDTSGSMAPNRYYQLIKEMAARLAERSLRLSVHCHNDMGMASANTVLGVAAGASVIEVTALGIGERNGIGDLYGVCRMLKDQGYGINVRTEDFETFRSYYDFVNGICVEKLGEGPLNYNTPVFGDAVKTHVAGTHGVITYSQSTERQFCFNVLCGKHMVLEHLNRNQISFNPIGIDRIVKTIKDRSVELDRGLTGEEVEALVKGWGWGRSRSD
jgi:isopropylmalate/homocitrate/citramalate synthase